MRRLVCTLALIVAPTWASAHTGDHTSMSFLAGLIHPFTGIDHLLAMLAFGIVTGRAAQAAPTNLGRWLAPFCTLSAIAFGGVLGLTGVSLPMAELAIAVSVVLAGIAALSRVNLPLHLLAAMCALFAVFHGYAHGAEMAVHHAALPYGAGILLGTGIVLLGGMGIAACHAQECRVG